jgi:hypothetical protein
MAAAPEPPRGRKITRAEALNPVVKDYLLTQPHGDWIKRTAFIKDYLLHTDAWERVWEARPPSADARGSLSTLEMDKPGKTYDRYFRVKKEGGRIWYRLKGKVWRKANGEETGESSSDGEDYVRPPKKRVADKGKAAAAAVAAERGRARHSYLSSDLDSDGAARRRRRLSSDLDSDGAARHRRQHRRHSSLSSDLDSDSAARRRRRLSSDLDLDSDGAARHRRRLLSDLHSDATARHRHRHRHRDTSLSSDLHSDSAARHRRHASLSSDLHSDGAAAHRHRHIKRRDLDSDLDSDAAARPRKPLVRRRSEADVMLELATGCNVEDLEIDVDGEVEDEDYSEDEIDTKKERRDHLLREQKRAKIGAALF